MTKEQFDRLYDENISKKEYDSIIADVDKRFGEVVLLIQPNICKGGWFVYGNYDYNSEKDEGYFDPSDFQTDIDIGGEFNFPEPYCFSDQGNGYIPTRWLWTEDTEILKEYNSKIDRAKQLKLKEKNDAKSKRAELKVRKAKFKTVIQSKLTKEELKYITFK